MKKPQKKAAPAAAPKKPAAVQRADILMDIALADLGSPGNVRSVIDVAAMVDDVRANGIRVPIIVRRDPRPGTVTPYLIEDGHRRVAAAKAAGRTTIPAIVRGAGPLSEEERVIEQIRHDMARAECSTADRARAVACLVAAGHKQAAIATIIGRSQGLVSQLAAIGRLPREIIEHQGEDPGHARMYQWTTMEPDAAVAAFRRWRDAAASAATNEEKTERPKRNPWDAVRASLHRALDSDASSANASVRAAGARLLELLEGE